MAVATLAIAAGCCGEYRFGGVAAKAAADIQQDAETRVVLANLETERITRDNLILKKEIVGREITLEQRKVVIGALKGKITEDVAVYMVRDPEAKVYGYAMAALMQDVGSIGRISFVPDPPPAQTGVMFCGNGSQDSLLIMKVLADQKLAGILSQGCAPGDSSEGCLQERKYQRAYCPVSSIFVGLRNPLNSFSPGSRGFVLIRPGTDEEGRPLAPLK